MTEEKSLNVAKAEEEVKIEAKTIKAKKRRVIVKQNKPAGVSTWLVPNKNQFEIDKVNTLSINGKLQSLPAFTSQKIDLAKIDGLNPAVAELFTKLVPLFTNKGYKLAIKAVLNIGFIPENKLHFQPVAFGHYHGDGPNGLIIRFFVPEQRLLDLGSKHGLVLTRDSGKFRRGLVTTDNVGKWVQFCTDCFKG